MTFQLSPQIVKNSRHHPRTCEPRCSPPWLRPTGGATSVIVAWHKPNEGPPAHVHFKQEEILFIIEGLYEVTVGNETAKAGPGSIVFIPRNVVHRFKNVGSIAGRMLAWSLPGGQDHYLKAISELAAGGGFTSEKVMEISKTFDTHFPVGP